MSDKLYALGKWAFGKRKLVVGGWLVIAIIMGFMMANFQQPASTALSIPGTEAQETIDKLGDKFPAATGASGRIAFAAPKGENLEQYKATVDTTLSKISQVEHVAAVVSPFQAQAVSPDGRIGYSQVQFDVEASEITEDMSAKITSALESTEGTGLEAEASSSLLGQPESALVGMGEIIGVGIAAVVLVITFGSLIAAGMPLAVALLSVALGLMGVFSLSGVFDVNSTTPILAIMLGLAVGIDYALFIVAKHRKYVMEGVQHKEAAGRAIATAGNAVVFAALTVVIALAGLSVVGIPFLTTMGLSAALTVLIAAVVAITLVPAMLGFAGKRILNKKKRVELESKTRLEKIQDNDNKNTFPYRWAKAITKKPLIPLLVGVAALLIIAIPAARLQLGSPGDGTAAPETTQRKAYDLLSEGFGQGFNGPLIVVADIQKGSSPEIAKQQLGLAAQNIGKLDNVQLAVPAQVTPDGETGLIQVIPKTGPSDTMTKDLVSNIRENRATLAGNSNMKLSVTGETAINIDIDDKLTSALPVYIAVVVGLSLIILLVVFRSILVPLKATLGFLLTIAATAGASVALFQWGWFGIFEVTPIVSFLPIIVIGILFGLAMDYEFFLVSGMHEAYTVHKQSPKKAVVDGFAHGSVIVTAAAIIMTAVFSGFITSGESLIQLIGFALAFGVLIDAFVVRLTIVPALMTLLGKAAWWIPKWLERILPNISIEGNEAEYDIQDHKK